MINAGILGDLAVKIWGDTQGLSDALRKSEKESKETQEKMISGWEKAATKMNAVGAKLTKGVTLPIIAGMTAAVKYATDLEETLSKVDVVFGNNAQTIKTWADTAIESMGLSAETAMSAAATYANMSDGMGIAEDTALEMAMSMTQLSADLASFNNTSQETAQIALNSIWTGETETLKKYGIVMTETNLAAFAMQQGITKNISSLSQAEKVQLRYNYVLANTANAQGDFARTSDSVANQTRMAKEQLKEAAATLGQNLLPIVSKGLGVINDLLKSFNEMDEGTQNLILTLGGIAAATGPLLKTGSTIITGFGKIKKGIESATEAGKTFGTTLQSTLGVVGLVLAGVTALGGVIRSLTGPSEEFKKLADDAKSLADNTQEAVTAGKQQVELLQVQQEELPELLDRLYELEAVQTKSTAEQTEMTNLVAQLNQQYSGLGLTLDKTTGKLNMQRNKLEETADAIYKVAEANAKQDAYYKAVQSKIDAEANLALAVKKVREEMVGSTKLSKEQIEAVDNALVEMAKGQHDIARTFETTRFLGADAAEGINAIQDSAKALEAAEDGIEYFADGLNGVADAATGAAGATDGLAQSVAEFTEADAAALMKRLELGQQLSEAETANLKEWKTNNAYRAATLEETVKREVELQQARVDAALTANEKIRTSDQTSLKEATANIKANTDLVKEYTADMDYLYGKIPDVVYEHLQDAGVEQARLVAEMAKDMRDGGGKIANDYVAAYIDGLYQGKSAIHGTAYDLGASTMSSTGEGIADNTEVTTEAGQQIQDTVTEMQGIIMADGTFKYLGMGIINQLANGMRALKWKVIDQADSIAKQIQERFNFSVEATATKSGAKIKSYDVGGYFTSPQLIEIAEKRPEFVGAADDLESFISKSVNNAFVGVNPILLRNVKLPQIAAQSGNVNVSVSMPISVSRSLTDGEIKQKAKTITGVVQRELAKITGGRVG